MRTVRRLVVPLGLGVGLALALLGLLSGWQGPVSAAPTADTRYVATGGVDEGNDCSTQAAPCRTIQHAVDVANAGDTVKVAAGVYTDIQVRPRNDVTTTGLVKQVVYISQTLTVRGGYTTTNWSTPDPDANPTTLDAQGQGRVIYVTGDVSPTIEYLRITGGEASWGVVDNCYSLFCLVGGGVYVFHGAPVFSHNRIYSNTAWFRGGALYLEGSRGVIKSNTFVSNSSRDAVYLTGCHDPVLAQNTLQGNDNWQYLSIRVESSDGVTIIGNSLRDESGGLGLVDVHEASVCANDIANRGVYVQESADVTITRNALVDSSVSIMDSSKILIDGNRVVSATYCGVRARAHETYSVITITNNAITGSRESCLCGVSLEGIEEALLQGNRIVSNTGERAGGVYLLSTKARLVSNVVLSNTSRSGGGGVCVEGGEVTLISNTLEANAASGRGGGVWGGGGDLTFLGNTIAANVATEDGGGLYLRPSVWGRFRDNVITGNIAGGDGGGAKLEFWQPSPMGTLKDNTFTNNRATGDGGGVYLRFSSSDNTFEDNMITANAAQGDGGGAYVSGRGTLIGNIIATNTATSGGGLRSRASLELINNVVADNQAATSGSGILATGGRSMLHNTLARNSGGDGSGICVLSSSYPAQVSLTNTILVSHSVGITVAEGSTVTLDGMLWGSGPWANGQDWAGSGTVITGSHDYRGDPAFVDPDRGDYHIGSTSAARDAGMDVGVRHDVDGQIRPMDWGFDIGADEYPGVGLHVAKQSSQIFVNPGQALTSTIAITSVGMEQATGVLMTHTLDALQQPVAIASSVGTCTITDDGWGGALSCTLGALDPGAKVVITITTRISSALVPGQAMEDAVEVTANETRNIAGSATYGQDCHVRINDDSKAYTSVQAAVDAASPGDLVKVAGVCLGAAQREGASQQVHIDKTLTVRGGYTTTNWFTPDPDANLTTLDALGQGRVLYISGDISPTVAGLRITGGNADDLQGSEVNEDAGGGIYVTDACATISTCQIYSNTAPGGDGGGIYLLDSDSVVIDSLVTGNDGSDGGGVYLEHSDALLRGNTVSRNYASGAGGVYLEDSDAVLEGNLIIDNAARCYDGGGLELHRSDARLINNVIANNQADDRGSGLYVWASSPCLLHTTIAHNTGGAGIHASSSILTLTNTVLVSHSVGITVTEDSTATLESTLWGAEGWANGDDWGGPGAILTGTNNHWGLPAFLDPEAGDYHITQASAAVDAGVDVGVGDDIDGSQRPYDGDGDGASEFDLGADELAPGLAVIKQARPTVATAGEQLTYTLHLTNTDNLTLHATITDTLPARVVPSGVLTWYATLPAPGGVWTETVIVTAEMGYAGPLTNTVQVATDEGASGRYTAVTHAEVTPGLAVTKHATPDPVQAGEQLTYTIRVTNTGNVALHATITDTLPTHVVPSSAMTWSTTIPAPESVWTETVVVTAEVDYTGPLTNVVSVTTDEGASGTYTKVSQVVTAYEYIYLPMVLRGR